jgi:hypothetical protein
MRAKSPAGAPPTVSGLLTRFSWPGISVGRSRARSEASIHGSVRALKPTEANSRFRETGRIPCPTHELPCGREKIPCPRRNKFPARLGLGIWKFAYNALKLRRELASGKLESVENSKKLPAKFPAIGNSSSDHPTGFECCKRPATAPAPRSRASRRHRSPTRPAPTARRSRIRSGRSAAWSACRSPCRRP